MTNLDAFVVSGNDDEIKKLKALIEKRQLSNKRLSSYAKNGESERGE